jgi:hypothetical protein
MTSQINLGDALDRHLFQPSAYLYQIKGALAYSNLAFDSPVRAVFRTFLGNEFRAQLNTNAMIITMECLETKNLYMITAVQRSTNNTK